MKEINLVLVSSILENCNNLMEKTIKIGQIARNAAIFKVNKIYLIKTKNKIDNNSKLIKKIFRYINTPQYLRKKRFSIEKDLKFVGMLPPLATYLHHLTKYEKDLIDGEVREGIILKESNNLYKIDIGIEKPITVKGYYGKYKNSSSVYVKIRKEKGKLSYIFSSIEEINQYLGFKTSIIGLPELLNNFKDGLLLGTSRRGENIYDISLRLRKDLKENNKIYLFFGSAKLDIFKLFKQFNITTKKSLSYIINFLPDQGVRTIRTEEAIPIVLTSLKQILNTNYY